MTQRRELSNMLAEVADGALATSQSQGIRTSSMKLSLPVEVALEARNGTLAVLAELPRFIFRTSFDAPPSRLTVVWQERVEP